MSEDPQSKQEAGGKRAPGGSFGMMAMMMGCCLSILLVFAIIPFVGLPIGLAIGAVGLVAMLFVHQKWMGGRMGHGGHR